MKKVTPLGIRTRLTALLLVVCMSIAVLPGSVIALENDSINYSNEVNGTANEAVYETLNETENSAEKLLEPIIIEEDITRRKANEKHFLCDDGSYIAISYPEAVHEEVNGEWVDVEYEVEENGGNISPVDEYIKVKFANNTNSAKLVKVEAGEYKISWTVEAETDTVNGIQKVKLSKDSKANIKTTKELVKENKDRIKANAKYTYDEVSGQKNNTKKYIENTDYAKISTLGNDTTVVTTNEMIESYNRDIIQSVSFAQSNVEYAGAFGEGTVLRYLLTPGEINEEIVLESYNGFKSYSMVMDTDGLTPAVDGQNRVVLTDEEGNVVMTIASPYMYDANDATSNEITVTVTQESKKTWRITYAPDIEWLTSSDRAYPIVIDPKVTTQNYAQSAIYDAYVYEGQTAYSNDSEEYLYVGYTNGNKCVSYWGIDTLPAIPSGATITSTGLYMRFADNSETCENICVYITPGTLNTSTLNWNNRPMPSTFMDSQATVPSGLWVNFCSLKMGTEIRNAYISNYGTIGFAIQYSGSASHDNYNMFCSSDHSNVAYRPYLSVGYTTSFYNLPEGRYYIQNVNSGLYLSAKDSASSNGTKVTQYSFSGAPSQIWIITSTGTGAYYISPQNATDKKLYHPTDNKPELSSYTESERNQWRFEQVSEGIYTISSVCFPWTVLDVDNYSVGENAIIYAYAKHGYANQQWKIVPEDTTVLNESYSASLPTGKTHWYKFTPTKSDYYNIFTYGDIDSNGALYQNGVCLHSDNNSGQNSNFLINYYLTKGVTYYIEVSRFSYLEGGDYTIMVLPSTYGNFSITASDYPVNEQRITDMNTSVSEYDIWPANSDSRYVYMLDGSRHKALSDIILLANANVLAAYSQNFDNAAEAFSHFLNNTGDNFIIDPEELCSDSPFVNNERISKVNLFLEASENLVPIGSTKTIHYVIDANNGLFKLKGIPDSTDWHMTLGGAEFRIKLEVTRTSYNEFSAIIEYIVIDFYDWDRNDNTPVGLVSPSDCWELHHGGYAKHFLTTGTSHLSISWTLGERWGSGAAVQHISSN